MGRKTLLDENINIDTDTKRSILVTGATGYVGGRLVPLLLSKGYRIRACARNPQCLEKQPWSGHVNVEIVAMDSLYLAFRGASSNRLRRRYYLIHSMIAGKQGFVDADRTVALNMVTVSSVRGVERIIYLGGRGNAT